MKKLIIFLLLIIQPGFSRAESTERTLSSVEIIKIAGVLVEKGDFEQAEIILTQAPPLGDTVLEIERWFLMGQISARRGDFDTAIKIFRKILDDQPSLARIRFELAICYMKTQQWYRADYHLRLAMADDELTDNVKNMMKYYRYTVRKNKNWNVWFNMGAAPDNNVNTSAGGEECVMTMFGPMCRQLPDPISAVGFNLQLGGNYEFKLSDNWRWKSDANIYTNIYNKHDYDDLYVSTGTGPRYVWSNGDIWLAGVANRRWYGWDGYNWSFGAKLDTNYDFTRKLSGGLYLRVLDNIYDDFGEYMDGQTYSANIRLSYSIDATKYLIFRTGLDRETTSDSIYSNWRKSLGIGFGAELPYGFHIYLEPSVYWTDYDDPRWAVKNGDFKQVTEHDFTQRYSVSLSNNKLDIWGFVPTLTFSYTNRDSNIWQKEYSKTAIEFTMQQRF